MPAQDQAFYRRIFAGPHGVNDILEKTHRNTSIALLNAVGKD
jgi:hypothetical protein